MKTHTTCAVVGGGISGIATAYYLQSQGIDAEIIEQQPTLGGRMATGQLDGHLIDLGGKNIGRRYTLFRALAEALGPFSFEPFGINTSRIRNGRIVTLDSTHRLRTTLAFLRGCGMADTLRLAGLCAHVWLDPRNRFLGAPHFAALARRFDDAPLSEHFSVPFCRAAVRPMSVRMNGAEPDEIHLGNFGTHLGIWLDTYDQLKDGMASLLHAANDRLRVRLGVRVEHLLVRHRRVVGLCLRDADGHTQMREYDHVILATPASVSAEWLREHDAVLAAMLASVRYFPVQVVVASYRNDIFSPQVRGLTFGPEKALSNAGAYGMERRNIVRYTFSGRTARALIARRPSADELTDIAERTLNRYIPVSATQRRDVVAHLFDPGLCAYTPHHDRLLSMLRDPAHVIDGLSLTGDYVCGASIEACMQAARRTTMRIVNQGELATAVRAHPTPMPQRTPA